MAHALRLAMENIAASSSAIIIVALGVQGTPMVVRLFRILVHPSTALLQSLDLGADHANVINCRVR